MRSARRLTALQLQDLEAELLSERARLQRAVRSHTPIAGGDDAPGELAYDASSLTGGTGLGLATHASARLEAIDAALARLADGSYGTCSGCAEHIPFGRLIVMPESALCIACGRV